MEPLVKLPMSLGLIVWNQLKEHGIEPRKTKLGIIDFSFKKEELELITELKIVNPTSRNIEGISLLPNLKKLELESKGITAHKQKKMIASISDDEIKEIAQCTSLEELSIVNQAEISYIDVSRLSNLRVLEIHHNENLDEIIGLEEINGLWEIDIFGNNRLGKIENLDRIILSNEELADLQLDVLSFPDAIGLNRSTMEYNDDALEAIKELDAKWKESMHGKTQIVINNAQMILLHNKACQILDENIPMGAETKDIIVGIERYMAKNVTYDYMGMNNGHTSGTKMQDGTYLMSGPKKGCNGAFNALILNKCVCEGYTRGMQYLLKLRGIQTHNVDCYAGKDETHMADESMKEDLYTTYTIPEDGYHSIICIDDYDALYCDPCWDACQYQAKYGNKDLPYCLKTKAEISKTHTLSFDERVVSNNHLSKSRNLIADSIKRNDLFIKTRMDRIKNMQQSLKRYRGQILDKKIGDRL